MQIEQVSDKKGLDLFILFPWKVYQEIPNWVPPIISEMKFILGDKNPFFHHAEAAYFLARKDGVVVGRIAAIVDRNHINIHKEQAGFFGFFECLPIKRSRGTRRTLPRPGSGNAVLRSWAP
jgi:hypothetical protein